MRKIEFFAVRLHKEPAIFYAGETITGTIELSVRDRLKINNIKLVAKGFARVYWTETHTRTVSEGSGANRRSRTESYTVSYSGHEEYFKVNLMLLSKTYNQDLYLEYGPLSLPFQITLPMQLPCTFMHEIGQILYTLKATVDIPWAFDMHSKRAITVLSHTDLNLNPALRQPYGVSDTKVACCGPCKSDPIIISFSVGKGGYVPGERIAFSATVDNRSNKIVQEMTLKFVQTIVFQATTKSKTCTRNILQIKSPNKTGPRSFETWNGECPVPAVVATSNGSCRIINVRYDLVLNVNPSGLTMSTNLNIPIVVGTIPLLEPAQNGGIGFEPPPPSYQSCSFGPSAPPMMPQPGDESKKGEMIENNQDSFVPLYPYYNYSS